MERVAFMIEDSGERIGCLLNPESLVIRRSAGVTPMRSANGLLAGAGMQDSPVLFTGGGRTTLEFDLLFDIGIAGSTVTAEDVRDLTAPLARLAENSTGQDAGAGKLPLVRFVWGKSWNIPGIVIAVAERFDRFAASGAPERSWMRMRFLRVDSDPQPEQTIDNPVDEDQTDQPTLDVDAILEDAEIPESSIQTHEMSGGDEAGSGERLDELADRYYGDPGLWRWIAVFNDIADPLHMATGLVLRIPPLINPPKEQP